MYSEKSAGTSPAARQMNAPHLVMAVGNHVVGDSRVEKAALSADALGYRVTVIGIANRTVPYYGFIDGRIPILRVPLRAIHHDKVAAELKAEAALTLDQDKDWGRKYQEERAVYASWDAWISRLQAGRVSKGNAYDDSLIERLQSTNDASELADLHLKSRVDARYRDICERFDGPENWRRIWPQIVDYEEVFQKAFEVLCPDLIHVHDRHPMAGAVSYCRKQSLRGINVRWCYDAHEWLPGQVFSGSARHRTGWLESERDLIRDAAVVITVSERMAEQLQEGHSLVERPRVVPNTPIRFPKVVLPEGRIDLRTDLGLAKDVPLIVYSGAVAERRGVLTMVEGAAALPELHVAFLAAKSSGRKLIADHAERCGVGDRVHILDYVPANSVSQYISSADVGVSPLLSTPAHHQASPTKIYEYLHARLPVVASNMREQEKFVSKNGIGEVYKAGDVEGFVEALKKVLECRDSYTGNFTDELLSEFSWERYETELLHAWSEMKPVDRTRLHNASNARNTVAFAGVPEGVSRFDNWDVISMDAIVESGDTMGPSGLDFPLSLKGKSFLGLWERGISGHRLVVSDGSLERRLGWSEVAFRDLLSHSQIEYRRYLESGRFDDIDMILDLYSDHWLRDLSSQKIGMLTRQCRRARNALLQSGAALVTESIITVASLAMRPSLLPAPGMEIDIRRTDSSSHSIVGIAAVRRSHREAVALQLLEKAIKGVEIRLIRPNAGHDRYEGLTLLIDGLSEDLPSLIGRHALALGVPVVVGSLGTDGGHERGVRLLSSVFNVSLAELLPFVSTFISLIEGPADVEFTRKDCRVLSEWFSGEGGGVDIGFA